MGLSQGVVGLAAFTRPALGEKQIAGNADDASLDKLDPLALPALPLLQLGWPCCHPKAAFAVKIKVKKNK